MNTTKEEVLERLKEYFKYVDSDLLEILDTPSKTAEERGGYTGVTIAYLQTYVVPNAEPSILIECINELLDDKIVARIMCENIHRIVIEKHKSDHFHYRDSVDTQQHITQEDLNKSGIFDIKKEKYRSDFGLIDDEEE